MYDINKVREDFPILSRKVYDHPLVYLDNAATTQKPRVVVDSITNEYYSVNANVHRGVHYLSQQATDLHEAARETVRRFIHAKSVSEIVFTRGTTEGLNLVASTFADEYMNEGDEVIIPGPYWVSYPDQIVLAGGTPVFIMTDETTGFKITPEQLDKAITPKTRYLILNSPCNPTGSTYSKEELAALGEVLLKHEHVLVVADDIYERLIYDGLSFYNIAQVVPALKSRTIVVNGVSKTYAMTGWRIGYACGPKELMGAMTKMQSQSTSNATSIAQKASVEALNGPQEPVAAMCVEFEKRRSYIVERLNAMPGVSCFKSNGAFYVFPNFSGVYGKSTPAGKKIETSSDFAAYLLEDAKVALVPGIAFGDDRYARLSYAISMENIKKGMDRIEEAIKNLK